MLLLYHFKKCDTISNVNKNFRFCSQFQRLYGKQDHHCGQQIFSRERHQFRHSKLRLSGRRSLAPTGAVFQERTRVAIRSGRTRVLRNTRQTAYRKKGDLFYLPKNVLLAYYADENDPYYYYWIGIDGASAKKLTERTGLTEFSPVKYYGDDEITAFYKEIEKYLNENTFAGHLAATGKAYELMARLLAGNEDNIQKLKSVSVEYADAAIQYIKNHFNEDITVQSIADHIGIGRSYLSVIFSRHTSMPPVEYLVRYRVDQAGKMLKQGLSVTDTAINCGFNSPSHFSVQFKKITGRTPAEFRKRKGQ